MRKFYLFWILTTVLSNIFALSSYGAICKKDLQVSIKMDDNWLQKEDLRLHNEAELLQKYAKYISKEEKPLIAEKYWCVWGDNCDPVKNCQMESNVENLKEVEYSMKIDIGINIKKSHCSEIGKCIGYNDFVHTSKITASEDRLIDIRKDNALFYHYFYSAKSDNYEPPFNMTNFHTGSELYLNDMPHFSPDEKFMVEIRSVPKSLPMGISPEYKSNAPEGFNINIYEMNEYGEYKLVEPNDVDPENPQKMISTFLSRNAACGPTPYFHSWKSNREIRLSMLPPKLSNYGRRVILSYDKNTKKWGCQEDLFPDVECKSPLPGSIKFSSNLAEAQIDNCL